MLVAFRKGQSGGAALPSVVKPNKQAVKESLSIFREQIAALTKVLTVLIKNGETIYGYGGAQMLPALAYHLQSDLSFLRCVLDDNESRHALRYPHLPLVIKKPEDGFTLEGAAVLITALDSARPIMRRVMALKAKRILMPLHIF
jgi:hypothetical protein